MGIPDRGNLLNGYKPTKQINTHKKNLRVESRKVDRVNTATE